MYDYLLKNAVICDGTGVPAAHGDIAVKDGRIAKISKDIRDAATRTVDLGGLVAAPGFIDIHTHSESSFLRDERNESKIFQGVTSEVVGHCGITPYPALPGHLADLVDFLGTDPVYDKPFFASRSLAEYLGKVAGHGAPMTTNLLPLVGHSALRAGVMGFEDRPPTAQELLQMGELLDESLAAGAWGLSLGLAYTPGVFSNQAELVSLGHVVKRHGGFVIAHIRNQAEHILEAMDEIFEINRRSGAPVQLTHLKVCRPNCGASNEVLAHLRAAQVAGIQVSADMYPYAASETNVANMLPKWALEGGLDRTGARLAADSPDREKLLAVLRERFQTPEDGEGVRIVSTFGSDPSSDGKSIGQIARAKALPMAEAAAEIIHLSGGRASAVYFSMTESDVMNFLKEDDISIGSDSEDYPYAAATMTHPRHYGTFPRFLRLAREHGLCSLETAVHRITQLPARQLGLTGRGVLREGCAADITVFDPERVRDSATYENPCRKPEGFVHIMVGGLLAVFDGKQTDARPGRFILRGKENS